MQFTLVESLSDYELADELNSSASTVPKPNFFGIVKRNTMLSRDNSN
ncbi:hypothetical protein PFLA_a1268 [Pseudoalteromonas flavipulchra NCIMB 2033 = ATCC BAA-314]|nr:hypothetical protein [Pseudoalteromonas flavipulchra NCIMB 2033 = ATCC BAA-314]